MKETSQAYCGVLDHVLGVITKVADGSDKKHMADLSKKVATSVADLVKTSEQLKGNKSIVCFEFSSFLSANSYL